MSYARRNLKNIVGSIVSMVLVAAISTWQFYKYVTFKHTADLVNINGTTYLWWAIAMAVFACGIGFLVFSVFLRHDPADELHIAFAPTVGKRGSQ